MTCKALHCLAPILQPNHPSQRTTPRIPLCSAFLHTWAAGLAASGQNDLTYLSAVKSLYTNIENYQPLPWIRIVSCFPCVTCRKGIEEERVRDWGVESSQEVYGGHPKWKRLCTGSSLGVHLSSWLVQEGMGSPSMGRGPAWLLHVMEGHFLQTKISCFPYFKQHK